MIRVSGLTKIFATGTKAIDDLTLEVKQGEIIALLGPNGAGKTTTIRVLSTLSGFDEGSVTVAGHDVDVDPEAVRCAIGLVAQQTGVDYFLTGRENLMTQGHLYRMAKADIEKRIEELASYFGLTDALDRLVTTYSGGMRRKLDIATALIHNPSLLFLDEPTLGLDIKSRQSLWQYINKLNREQGLTILLTTHYLEEADHLSHRVAIINQGKIQVIDTPQALKNSIHGDAVMLTFASQGPDVGEFTFAMHEDPTVQNVVWQNDNLYVYVDNGGEAVPRFVRLAEEKGLTIKSLSLAHPTLDDVFLKYTGTTLEETKEEEGEEWWHQWAGKGGGGGGKWQKNWEKWQGQLEESGSDEDKAGWQAQMQKWQGDDATTAAPAATPAPETPAQSEAAPAKPGDWQQWQQQANASGTPVETPEHYREEALKRRGNRQADGKGTPEQGDWLGGQDADKNDNNK